MPEGRTAATVRVKPCVGGVKVILDVGWYRDEVNTDIPEVDLANGQQHVVSVKRHNRGRTVVLKVRRVLLCCLKHAFTHVRFLFNDPSLWMGDAGG